MQCERIGMYEDLRVLNRIVDFHSIIKVSLKACSSTCIHVSSSEFKCSVIASLKDSI